MPTRSPHPAPPPHDPEAGYMLLAVVVMAAVVLIGLAVAAPVLGRQIRRDKEVESMHRADQYVRAIRLYQRACRCQSYPPSMDALEKNTTVRFLRQRYVDPLTGKSDWKLIHDPQTKIHVFFGQELGELISSGNLGSAQSMVSPGIGAAGTPATTIGQTSGLAAGFGGATIGGSSGSTGSTSSTSSSDTGMFGDSTGGPIKGVSTARTGDSILTVNGQTTYDSQEFWWDPRMELLYAKSNILGGGGIGSAASTDATKVGKDATTGQPNGASGATGSTGSSSVFGTGSGLGGSSPR